MEWNIFDKWLDIRLYRQMKALVYLTCSKEDKYGLNRENKEYELFTGEAEKTMEEEYGLHYPGEVLERLGEHREITVRQIRALGLALARTKNLHEDNMFIGNQLTVFLNKMKAQAEGDVFLLGICYLINEKTKKQSYEAFVHYPYGELAEILFALSVLPKDDSLWETVKGKLNAKLGKERNLSVYENMQVYIWLAQNFQFRVKGYRKKDMDAFKYLMRLPFENAFGEGTVRKKLLENGYGADEISYLNCTMIREVNLPDGIRMESITAEKMAIEACRYFLNAQGDCTPQAYELCRDLCSVYKTFRIKVTGYDGLADALSDKVAVKNVTSFLILYPYLGKKKSVRWWSRFSLADSGWDALYQELSREEYDACVTEALLAENDADKLAGSLKRYEEITGGDYRLKFWKSTEYHSIQVFSHLADYGAIPVKEYLEQSLTEYNQDEGEARKKWEHMAWYLQRYMNGVSTQEAYGMLKLLVKACGVSEGKGLYSVGEVIKSCFVYERGYYTSQKKLEIFRPFLEAEEHQSLFSWIEEYVFLTDTEEYLKFLLSVLEQEDNLLWFPKEDARAVFLCLWEKTENKEGLIPLQVLYLTGQEQQDLQSRENFIRERKDLKRRMETVKEMKLEFTEKIAESRGKAGQFLEISRFIRRQPYGYTDEAKKIASGYLRAFAGRGQIYLQKKMDLEELFSLLSSLYTGGMLEMEEIREMVGKVEMKGQYEEMEVSE